MLIRRWNKNQARGFHGPASNSGSKNTSEIETLEARLLFSEAASAQLHLLSTAGTAAAPIYHYDITLTNKGTTNLGTFWLGWIPGEDNLPSTPSASASPSGWSGFATGSGDSFDGTSIQWVAQSTTAALAPGKTLGGFDFTSADSPAKLAGRSPSHPPTPVLASFVYSGGPFSDAGFQFNVSPAAIAPTLAPSTTHLTSSATSVLVGTMVTFSAKVASATAGGAIPTGTVTFKTGAVTLGTVALNSAGVAVLAISSLSVGAHSITAVYAGNSKYLGSNSAALTATINAPPALNSTVTADITLTNADLTKFKTDLIANTKLLLADAVTIKTDDPKQATVIAPAITKLNSDVKAIQAALTADHLTDATLVMADESTIRAEGALVILDKANASKEAADKSQLKTDRIKLQTDLLAALTARIALRQADDNTLIADANHLVSAIGAGSGASTALQGAVTRFVNDKTAGGKMLLADLTKLAADKKKVTVDLTAEQST